MMCRRFHALLVQLAHWVAPSVAVEDAARPDMADQLHAFRSRGDDEDHDEKDDFAEHGAWRSQCGKTITVILSGLPVSFISADNL